MTRLRYNGLSTTLGASLTSSATAVTFAAALTHSGGTAVPTITAGDSIPLSILDSTGKLSEVVYLTAYTSGATTGTITRGQEGTTGVSHASGDRVVHGPTVADVPAQSYVGKNAVGGSLYTLSTREILYKQVVLASAGLLADIEAYIDPNSSGNVHAFGVALLADNAGVPGQLLQANMTPNVSLGLGGSTSPRWFGMPLGRWLVPATYWLAIQWRLGAATNWKIAHDTSGSDRSFAPGGDWFLESNSTSSTTRDHSIRGNIITV